MISASPRHSGVIFLMALVLATGCSVRQLAVNRIGDALAAGGDVYASDDDPELVGDALPFSLKLIESFLAENPRHRGLLLAAARDFTQYSYGWVEPRVAEMQATDSAGAATQEQRARRLYQRARNYGLRGLETTHPNFESSLRENTAATMKSMKASDVPLLYWTAASWGLLISLSKDQPDTVADLPLVEGMIDRALQLDESYDHGAIHSFLIAYEPNRAEGTGDPLDRSRKHFERAVELSNGKLASPYVALAETVSVQKQDRAEFDSMLKRALAIDPDAAPQSRVENLLAQKRARWLLAHADDLFLSTSGGDPQ